MTAVTDRCSTCGHMSYQHGPERCLDCRSSDRMGGAIPGVVVCTKFTQQEDDE